MMASSAIDWHDVMTIEDLPTYQNVIEYLAKEKNRPIHLLLGNGFSVAYDFEIFSYDALSIFIENSSDDLLKQLFNTVNTKNFEEIMRQLDLFAEFSEAFGAEESFITKVTESSEKLKQKLIDAVKSMHPKHVFKIPDEQSKSCCSYLEYYLNKNNGKIFSSNYDLLLYWVLVRNKCKNANDGFGRDIENSTDHYIPSEEVELSELRWGRNHKKQTIFYLHGALPLFDTGIEVVKEEYDGEYLLEKIKNRINSKEYPIFVTAGTSKDKLTHIMHNRYLSFCYDELCKINGSLVTYGFSFSENDTHIIDAINKAAKQPFDKGKLFSVYIGVYSDNDLAHIKNIKKLFKKVKPYIYNAKTVNAWGK